MRSLEEVIIETLNHFGIQGVRVAGRTGVWTEIGAHGTNSEHLGRHLSGPEPSGVSTGTTQENGVQVSPAKIASIGVRISRWVTLHGLSLNVRDCSDGFSLINPCGFQGIRISSMEEISQKSFEIGLVKEVLIDNFRKVFR
jgi:lipoate-protein ligase B